MHVYAACVELVTSWFINQQTWRFPEMGKPQNGGFLRDTPIKMDDVGVPPFQETNTHNQK